ncbi:MAG TPA: flagellar basal body-associated protein FliL [Pseudogracilibacillus sp.]|nr:flagellar basal body-associated protein FliL [Pseudogracilibacillus sp.]
MNNLLKIMLISFSVLIVSGIISFVVIMNFTGNETKGEGRSIDDINALSFETPEVTTDLQDGTFVRIQFQIVTDSKKALQEVEKREFQIKNIIIKELAVMTESDFSEDLSETEKSLQHELNDLMTEGTITDVYTISKILQ